MFSTSIESSESNDNEQLFDDSDDNSSSSDKSLDKVTPPRDEFIATEESIDDQELLKQWTNLGFNIDEGNTIKKLHYTIGIDEAGRGACIGPMVYGVCAVETSKLSEFRRITGVKDSKQATVQSRFDCCKEMAQLKNSGWSIYWGVVEVHSKEIDARRMGSNPLSLNVISVDAVKECIKRIMEPLNKVSAIVDEVIVDAIGNTEILSRNLRRDLMTNYNGALHGQNVTKITVESKADINYATVSAASIWAKSIRDLNTRTWEFNENIGYDRNWGCGYPSDPLAVKWIENNVHPVFGLSDVVRHSWRNVVEVLKTKAYNAKWSDDFLEDTEI